MNAAKPEIVPMPPSNGVRRTQFSLDIEALEVGESIAAPEHMTYVAIRSLAASLASRLGRTYSTRKTRDGVRVWRTQEAS